MMKRIFKRLRGSERGFTLMEVLVAVAILGAVSSAMTGVIFGIFSSTDDNNGRVAAVTDIEIAGHQMSEDGMSAYLFPTSFISTISQPNDAITLVSSESFTKHHEITYSLSGTDLQRQSEITDSQGTSDPADDVTTTTTKVLARDVTDLQFTQDGDGAFIVSMTTTGGGTRIAETREYQIELRVSD